jgi:phospholipid/cholesterol/gamma-HCH transport system substrate-binding protein
MMGRLRIPSWRDVNQLSLGLATVVVLGCLLTAAFSVGALDLFSDRYELSAVFPDAGGMKTGNDVRVAGVPVGEVTGIHPDFQTGQVIIAFEVDKGTDLGPETRADIAAATLLGGYYLRLSGRVEEPFLEDLPSDDARRRIPLERTSAPVSLIGALSDTTTQIQTIDIDAVNAVLRQLAGATDRNADVVPTLIDSLSTVGAAIASREDELRDLVGNASALSEVLAQRDEEILTLVEAASVLLDRLQERRDELATVLGSGSEAVVTLTDTIKQHRADIDGLLADAHVLLEGIERNTGTINTSLAWAGPLFTLLGSTLAEQGGFNVGVEGFIGTTDHLKALISILVPPGGA